MATLTFRSAIVAAPPAGSLYTNKVAPLTNEEIDRNFLNLDIEIHQNATNIELNRQRLPDAGPIIPVATIPDNFGNPVPIPRGKIWLNTLDDMAYIWNGANWIQLNDRVDFLNELFDVDTSPLAGHILVWDPTAADAVGNVGQWINVPHEHYIDDLLDVDTTGVAQHEILQWDSTAIDADGRVGQWVPTNIIDGSPDGGATDDF